MIKSNQELHNSIDQCISELSEKHRMHRKIKFLLDIRGLLVINKLKGSYLEFGVFRGEMMYAAAQILKGNLDHLFGFDTFQGLPEPTGTDSEQFVFEQTGFMSCPEKDVSDLLEKSPHTLVKGDFREPSVISEITKSLSGHKASVVSIDCNWPSSVLAALKTTAPFLVNGSIVYFDDYFTATRSGDYMRPIMEEISRHCRIKFHEFMTYPPCARAFIIECDSK